MNYEQIAREIKKLNNKELANELLQRIKSGKQTDQQDEK
jgi:hypothetical protein